jgi:hypothetical protein
MNDDDIMKAANKFLKSVEKQKKKYGDTSSSEQSSLNNGDNVHTSVNKFQSMHTPLSSISTPTSDMLELYDNDKYPVKNSTTPGADELNNFQTKDDPIDADVHASYSPQLPTILSSRNSSVSDYNNQNWLSDGEVLSIGEVRFDPIRGRRLPSDDEDDDF